MKRPAFALRWDSGDTVAWLMVLVALLPPALHWLGVIHLDMSWFDPTVGP